MRIVDNLYERYLKYIYIKQNKKKHVFSRKNPMSIVIVFLKGIIM